MKSDIDPSADDNSLGHSLQINSVTIPNRLVRSATHENMADEHGFITDEYLSLYEGLAKGNTGLLITGHMFVDIQGRCYKGMAGISDDQHIKGLKKVTSCVHKHRVKIFAQLNHTGLKTFFDVYKKNQIIAPSKRGHARKLTLTEIDDIIESFGNAAKRVKRAGFDGIQIHGAHSYLIAQFLSKHFNHRHDQYGGSLKNRQRFFLEVITCIREAVGSLFPVSIKLDSYSHSYASMPPLIPIIPFKEAMDTAKQCEASGIDAVEVSCGFFATRGPFPIKHSIMAKYYYQGNRLKAETARFLYTPIDALINQQYFFKFHHNIKHIRLFKQNLSIPVLGGSCFRNPEYMKQVIQNKWADMICMCRPLVIDPFFSQKILQGYTTSSKCINCNLCLMLSPVGRPLRCYYGKPPDFSKQMKP